MQLELVSSCWICHSPCLYRLAWWYRMKDDHRAWNRSPRVCDASSFQSKCQSIRYFLHFHRLSGWMKDHYRSRSIGSTKKTSLNCFQIDLKFFRSQSFSDWFSEFPPHLRLVRKTNDVVGCLVDAFSLSHSLCLVSLPLDVCWFLQCESMQSTNAMLLSFLAIWWINRKAGPVVFFLSATSSIIFAWNVRLDPSRQTSCPI